MAILDIRNEKEEEITGIRFDASSDLVAFNNSAIFLLASDGEETTLCDLVDFDNFIAALYKAKELAGK